MQSELHIEKFCKCKSIDLNQIPSFCAHTYNLKILLTCRSPTQNRIINSISNQRKYFVVATKLEFVMQIYLADRSNNRPSSYISVGNRGSDVLNRIT